MVPKTLNNMRKTWEKKKSKILKYYNKALMHGLLNHKHAIDPRRLKIVNDIIVGIKTIKCYAWEIPFEKLVSAIRYIEIVDLIKSSNAKGLSSSLAMSSGILISLMVILIKVNN